MHLWPFYDTMDTDGPTDVVLTKFMLMRTSAVALFQAYASLLGLERGLGGGKPVWNGEDLFMNLVHQAAARRSNFAIRGLPGVEDGLPWNGQGEGTAISKNIPKDWTAIWSFLPGGNGYDAARHLWHRTRLWTLTSARLDRVDELMARDLTISART